MMNDPLVSGLITIVVILVAGYFAKLDMADITGLARRAAINATPPLAQELGYELIPARTPDKQGGLKKDFGRYEIKVEGNASRIQVDFKKDMGLVLSTLANNDFGLGKTDPIEFSNSELNKFFKLRGAKAQLQQKQQAIEAALAPLQQQFANRKLKFLYLKDEYLRITFAYRHYLPADTLKSALPAVEQAANALVALK